MKIEERPAVRASILAGSAPTVPSGRHDTSELRQRVTATVAMSVLAVALPLTVVDWRWTTAELLNIALVYLIVLLSSLRLTKVLASGSGELFRAFFYLFVYIFMGLAPLAQVVRGAFPLDNRTYSEETITLGLLSVLLGIVGYEVGWYVSSRRKGRTRAATPRVRWYFSRARTVVLGIAGITVVAYQVTDNGLSGFFVSRAQTASILTNQDPAATQALYNVQEKTAGLIATISSHSLVFIALFAILYSRRFRLWRQPGSLLADMAWRLFIVVLVAANLIMNNPIGNSRVWFCLVLAAFLSIYFPFDRPRAVRTYVAAALFIFVFLFSSFDAFRASDSDSNESLRGPGQSFVADGTYAMFQMHLTGIEYVASEGRAHGHQMVGAVLSFVPRSIWTDKPQATGQLIDPPLLRSTTAWTELDIDFGPAGVLLGFVLLGAGSAWLSRRSAGASAGFMHAVVPLVAVFQIFVLRGSLLPAMGYVYQMAAIFVLVLTPIWIRRDREPDPVSGEGSSQGGADPRVDPRVAARPAVRADVR